MGENATNFFFVTYIFFATRPSIILPQHSFDMSSTAPVEEPLMLSVPSVEEQEKQRAYKEQQIKFYKAEAQKARQANVSPGRFNIPEQ